MNLLESIRDPRLSLSFEVFPPKNNTAFSSVLRATEDIAALEPSYVSVTYGAGGVGGRYTLDIARSLRRMEGAEILAHLTCVGADRSSVKSYLEALRAAGIRNVMALRGDLPQGTDPAVMAQSPYPHAVDLIRELKAAGGFCIGAACYPEVHPESPNQAEDLRHLREKVEAGAEFLTTQMFFDNNLLYNFLYKLREAGVTVPVVPGIMPITGANQVRRALELSGSFMPRRFTSLVDRFGSAPEAMKRAGIIYATDQIIDLFANGIRHVHVYTMNKPEVARAIRDNLSGLLGREF
ncbi:MAG: methylenetetrahydrofolate reductase [Oscillospiraceae bacterium]|nr:methylenetetrahydrofolate reductase [Oscillospiraceae bacterium]